MLLSRLVPIVGQNSGSDGDRPPKSKEADEFLDSPGSPTAVSCSNRSTTSMLSEKQAYPCTSLSGAVEIMCNGGLETGVCATGAPRKQRAMHYATHELHASGFWVVVVFDFLLTGTTRGLSTTAQGARIMFHLCAQNFAKIVDDIRQQT